MPIPLQDDVLLYEEVLRLLDEEEQSQEQEAAEPRPERRTTERCSYEGWQLIAPYRHRRPRQHEFIFIRCRDLSAGGLSFITDDPEIAEEYVVALGAAPFRFLIAQVTNKRFENESGEGNIVVGCRFVRGLV